MCVGTEFSVETGQDEEGGKQTRGVARYDGNCSEDQKEKCREAAKVRRSREAEYFKELENLLPVQNQVRESEETHFDKISLIRFSVAYLKTREVINSGYFTSSLKKEKLPKADIIPCLDGFTLVLSPDGDVIYTSDNITRYLGLTPVDILGHPLTTYVHPCDQHQLQLLTCDKWNTDDYVEILARVKCLVTERGRLVNLKQASYKSLKISGKIHQLKKSKHGGMTGAVFIGMARMVWSDGANTQQAGVFSTKHGMDMRFSEADPWLCTVAGYSPHQMMGASFYTLVHPQDSMMVQKAFKTLYDQGVCETAPYRLLCHGGGQVWVQTVAKVVCRRGKQGQAVVCKHSQIRNTNIGSVQTRVLTYNFSGVFDRGEVLSLNQLRHVRKSNERKRDHQLMEKKGLRRMNRTTCGVSAAHSLETTEYDTKKGFQKTIKPSIPVIIDRRQNSDKQIIDQNMKLSTECQPRFVTSSLFENSESLGMEFSSHKKNYLVILDKNDEITKMETYTQIREEKEIADDTDYLKNFQQLEESILVEDLEQLSPHCGNESVTFDKDDEFEFLDFVKPAEFEPNCQASCWTNSGKQKSEDDKRAQIEDNYGEDHDITMGFQVESIKRKAENGWEKLFDEIVRENSKVMEMKSFEDASLQEQSELGMWQSPWTSRNTMRSGSMQGTRTMQDQSSPTDWSGAFNPVLSCEARIREGGTARSLGGIFKRMRFESNMQ